MEIPVSRALKAAPRECKQAPSSLRQLTHLFNIKHLEDDLINTITNGNYSIQIIELHIPSLEFPLHSAMWSGLCNFCTNHFLKAVA